MRKFIRMRAGAVARIYGWTRIGTAISLLLASLLVVAVPVAADTTSWSIESIPSTTGMVVAAGTDVADLAVNGDTIYATGGVANVTYKSTDCGQTWSDLSTTTDYPAGQTIKLVAVAPDDTDLVAIVTADENVFYSIDGGSSWSDMGRPAADATLNCTDISPT
ncbi:WD40/YVTN/BNR-like repeat-containing protein, partial [Chloroflexota bacterium]